MNGRSPRPSGSSGPGSTGGPPCPHRAPPARVLEQVNPRSRREIEDFLVQNAHEAPRDPCGRKGRSIKANPRGASLSNGDIGGRSRASPPPRSEWSGDLDSPGSGPYLGSARVTCASGGSDAASQSPRPSASSPTRNRAAATSRSAPGCALRSKSVRQSRNRADAETAVRAAGVGARPDRGQGRDQEETANRHKSRLARFALRSSPHEARLSARWVSALALVLTAELTSAACVSAQAAAPFPVVEIQQPRRQSHFFAIS